MKALVLAVLFVAVFIGEVGYARDYIETSDQSEVKILDSVVGFTHSYSHDSQLDAKLFEVMVADTAMNSTRMVLVLNNGYESRIFELGIMMNTVKKMTFLNTDVLVIQFTVDALDTQKTSTLTLEIIHNEDGSLANMLRIIK